MLIQIFTTKAGDYGILLNRYNMCVELVGFLVDFAIASIVFGLSIVVINMRPRCGGSYYHRRVLRSRIKNLESIPLATLEKAGAGVYNFYIATWDRPIFDTCYLYTSYIEANKFTSLIHLHSDKSLLKLLPQGPGHKTVNIVFLRYLRKPLCKIRYNIE
jgi:hypothetical protein